MYSTAVLTATVTLAGAEGVMARDELPTYVLAIEYCNDVAGGFENAMNVFVNVWFAM